MSDTPTPDGPTPTPEPEPDTPAEGKTFTQADVDRIVANRVKKYADYDELRTKAEQLAALEEAQKTNEQKLTEALDEARSDATTSKTELLRLRVAIDKGLDAELVDFLPAGSKEEIEEAADKLLAKLGDPQRRRPRPTPSQGMSQGDPNLTPGDEFAGWLKAKI